MDGSDVARVRFRIGIIGGGVAGTSLLYHLAERGLGGDTVLFEADELTSGSTWHAAGLCTQFHSNLNLAAVLRRSIELYGELQASIDGGVGFHQCGSIRLATTPDRLDQFLHWQRMAEVVGIESHLIDAAHVDRLFPLARIDDVLGAVHIPSDGHIDPSMLTRAFTERAQANGATVFRRHPVQQCEWNGASWVLTTPDGKFTCDTIVNAAGQWSRQVAELAGGFVPVIPLQHHYVVTDPVADVRAQATELPVLRDPEASFYVRQEGEGLLLGPFEPQPLTWAERGVPEDFHGRLLAPNLEQIETVLELAGARVPSFGDAGIRSVVNGPDGYSPDGVCLMGPVPGLRQYHVLTGFSIFGIVFAGGAGEQLAEWLTEGRPPNDMWSADARRFGDHLRTSGVLAARACQVYEREYAIHYPEQELPAGRPVKTSPIHDLLADRGAVFGERFGWERPLWFASEAGVEDEYSFRQPNWHASVAAECAAVQQNVGLLDQTSFAKFGIVGAGAHEYLERMCANRISSTPGRITLTQLCNEKGGIEADLTVTCDSPEEFYVVSAAATEAHDLDWLMTCAPAGGVAINNLTSQLGVITLAGPRSRELLQRLTTDDIGDLSFFRSCSVDLAGVPTRVMRLSYVGELGFELHHSVEHQLSLFTAIDAVGVDLGLSYFGYRALESMRLEKAFRLWGVDLAPQYTPFEAGLGRFVDLDKPDFIGREALIAQHGAGPSHELTCLAIDAGDALPVGSEPVLLAGEVIGYLAAAGYGHRVGTAIGMAYLPRSVVTTTEEFDVGILDQNRTARTVAGCLYDPTHSRMRGEPSSAGVA